MKKFLSLSLYLFFISHLFGEVEDPLSPVKLDWYKKLTIESENLDLDIPQGFSGALLLFENGNPVVSRGYGLAYEKEGTEFDTATPCRIGSLTKQFTAVSILMLAERRSLKLDDLVSKYVPELIFGDRVSIRQLLTHTSGVPEYSNLQMSLDVSKYWSCTDLVALFKDWDLDFIPGQKFQYSNSNYVLLGLIMEKITNERFENFIIKNIINKINLNKTGFEYLETEVKIADFDNGISGVNFNTSFASSAGGMYSTAEDLLKWLLALNNNGLITEKSKIEMWTPSLEGYGLGWLVEQIHLGGKEINLYSHDGSIPGFYSHISWMPGRDRIFIYLTNNPGFDEASTLYPMENIFFRFDDL